MPIISVSMYPGRSKEQKADFAKAITNAAVQILGTKPEHVIIIYKKILRKTGFFQVRPSKISIKQK
jgi:4-oxalocrotonate tautomerase